MAGGDEIHCKLPKNYSQTIIQKLDVGLGQPSKNSVIHRVAYIEGNGQSLLHLNHISTPLVKTYDLDAVYPLKPSENKCIGLHTKLHTQTFEGNHCISSATTKSNTTQIVLSQLSVHHHPRSSEPSPSEWIPSISYERHCTSCFFIQSIIKPA